MIVKFEKKDQLLSKDYLLQGIMLYGAFFAEILIAELFLERYLEKDSLLFWVCGFTAFLTIYSTCLTWHKRWLKNNEINIWHIQWVREYICWMILAIVLGILFRRVEQYAEGVPLSSMLVREVKAYLGMKPLYLGIISFVTQQVYYLYEFTLMAAIVVAIEGAASLKKLNKRIPWGGIFLGLTWGLGHWVTKDSLFNGVACMIGAMIGGYLYIICGKKMWVAWAFFAAWYML